MTECECLDFFVDEACGAFLARKDRIMCIGVACLFLGGRSDMTIDVLSRCNKGKHVSVGICFCGVCGVNSNSVGLIVLFS